MSDQPETMSVDDFFSGAPGKSETAPSSGRPSASNESRPETMSVDDFFKEPSAAKKEPQSWGDWMNEQRGTVAATLRGAREGMPFAKDIAAGAYAAGDYLRGDGFDFNNQKQRVEQQQEQARKEHPYAAAAGEIGSYFVPFVGVGGRALKAEQALASRLAPEVGKLGSRVISGGATGAALGAVQGLGTGTDLKERLTNAANTSTVGGVGGAAFPLAGAALNATAGNAARAVGRKMNIGVPLTEAEQAAKRQGFELPRYLGSDDPFTIKAGEDVGAIPFSGFQIRAANAKAAESAGEALDRITGAKTNITSEEAGDTAREAINDWIGNRSRKVANKAYDAIDQHVDKNIRTDLTNTRATLQSITDKLEEADLHEDSAALKLALKAATNPNGLTVSGIKTLRTAVRQKIKQGVLPGNLEQGQLKQLKDALDHDLRAAAQNAGGSRGLAAFERANSLYADISRKRKSLAKIVGLKGDASGTDVMNRIARMANDRNANTSRLMQVRKSLSPEQWEDVTASVINNMGRNDKGKYSPDRFLSEYGRMTEKGRDIMFGPVGHPTRDAIEDMHKISTQFNIGNQFHNWSNSAHTGLSAAAWLEFLSHPIQTAYMGAPSWPLARLLAQPKGAGMLSKFTRAVAGRAPPLQLRKMQDALMAYARGETSVAALPAPGVAEEKNSTRAQRATGGKVGKTDYPAKRLSRMERAAKRAREALALESKPLENMPDEHIAHALRIAEKK